MALTAQQRAELNARIMQEKSAIREVLPLSKTDLRAAINAVDDWLDANAASLNSAIPQPARGALTTAQKTELVFYVMHKRFR